MHPRYFRSDYGANPSNFDGPYENCVCIPMTGGQHTIIDAEDFMTVVPYRWSSRGAKKIYAASGKKLMHRLILSAPKGEPIDHANGNSLDNRRCNLRMCSYQQNNLNRESWKKEYKGVRKRKTGWAARTHLNGESYGLGIYHTEEDAARAYDVFAKENHGEFARLNFPREESLPGELVQFNGSHGGRRAGAGRKKKYTEPTKLVRKRVPVRLLAALDAWLEENGA